MEGVGFCRPPDLLDLSSTSNVADNWKRFRQRFEIFLKASGKGEQDAETKVALLLNFVGDDGLELFNNFSISAEDKKNYTKVLDSFEQYCAPKKNVIIERFKFGNIVQEEGQSFDNFLTALQTAVKSCDYHDSKAMIRDRIVIGISDKNVQERLLREPDLDLLKAVSVCKAAEATKQQSKILQERGATAQAVHWTKPAVGQQSKGSTQSKFKLVSQQQECGNCGYVHLRGRCPAYNKVCAKCRKLNHFAKVCRQGGWERRGDDKGRPINAVTSNSDDGDSIDNVYVSSVRGCETQKAWYEKLKVNNKYVIKCKLDSGAETSVLPLNMYMKLGLGRDKLEHTKNVIVSYGNEKFKTQVEGTVNLQCTVGGLEKDVCVPFMVVDVDNQPALLGLSDCINLNLISRVRVHDINELQFKSLLDVTRAYESVFKGLGCFPTCHKITIQEQARPHIEATRRVPYGLMDRLKSKLDELEQLQVVKKVEQPTEWVSALVIAEKPNKDLRLCLDPKYLNEAILRERFVIPTAEDIAATMGGNKFFTVLDMKDGYYQVPLDPNSINLCVFGTPFGRYQFMRMPFGIKSAPEVFQRKNFEVFGDLPGVQVYFDDIIVPGRTEQEHDGRLEAVLERALKYNIKFNPNKIQFKQPTVKFMGQVFCAEGVRTDEGYIQAVVDMEEPTCREEVLRFLGMVRYVGKFIPNLSKESAPLRELTRLDVKWKWGTEQQNSFNRLKTQLCQAPVLAFYDHNLPIQIYADASKDGLGACLMQNEHPVAFASRSLNEHEVRYAQIEKELLAIQFATNKFHNFIYGHQDVTVFTDHKPLVSVFQQDLNKLSVRLQRLRLKMLAYEMRVCYLPGKLQFMADTLSRSAMKETDTNQVVKGQDGECIVVNSLAMSDRQKQQFQNMTEKDEQLTSVLRYIRQGWPESKREVNQDIQIYWRNKIALSESEGILLMGNKIVVPHELRPGILKQVHEGHMGIEKTKSRARQLYYWPGISQDVEEVVRKCEVCAKYSRQNCKESLKPWPIASRPWERVATDIVTYGGVSYVVVIDAYSNWLEIVTVRDKSADSVINVMKSIFATHGIPDVVMADNVPYGSLVLRQFAEQCNFDLKLRSPHYPQSNGLGEKGVGICKQLLRKAGSDKTDLWSLLLEHRNTPLKHVNYSPSQLMMSRVCKTRLPVDKSVLKPCSLDPQEIVRGKEEQVRVTKSYYDRNCRDLPVLHSDQQIIVRNPITNTWGSGQVVQQSEYPRSYIVRDGRGEILRRNRRDLKESEMTGDMHEEQVGKENGGWPDEDQGREEVRPSELGPREGVTVNTEPENEERETRICTRSGRMVVRPQKLANYVE